MFHCLDRTRLSLAMTLLCWGAFASPVLAAPVSLAESESSERTYTVKLTVQTEGAIRTTGGAGELVSLPLQGAASFAFLERRLPSAGRDALAFRSVREFTQARMQTRVDGFDTRASLPASSRVVVSSGSREGVISYSMNTLLTRELVELIELPADPLTLVALLPTQDVKVGDSWDVSDWALQMLSGIEAVSSAKMKGTVTSIDAGRAMIAIHGEIQGLRHGARNKVQISGAVGVNLAASYVDEANLTYNVTSDPGSVSPGLQAKATITLSRGISSESGALTNDLLAKIPISPPDAALGIFFDAGPWNARLKHSRNWHLFQAVFDREPGVAILRLVHQGSLIAQCNLSPIPPVAPGEQTPLDQFEKDIRTALGASLTEVTVRDNVPLADGRILTRVFAKGNAKLADDKTIAMEWRYYICTDQTGQRMSFVFAVEPSLAKGLGEGDRQLVESLQFLPPQQAQKP
ncbi:MAG: hypothetical protein R3C01_08565 [Planctomycetaceae bacterium]